ncbi:PAS domain S-box protein [Sphingomonas sp. PL-96]|uniref:PAS domain S-box protein n=1 Tax=Sphingomonas sp. PL-96 TaxID=2887201 RepID=UPI001E65D669|nr:PAS domain S-box protein [Sphingomonas sp. PL-96]MCC2976585.1 PAS domain S-box protein [Sphingomonas sp. PL-96]
MDLRQENSELKRRLAAAEGLLRENAELHASIRESEARHRLLVDVWAQAVWETDAAGVVVTDSPSWRTYTGQTREEWLGYGWLDAIHPDDRAYAEQQWRGAIAARKPVDAEFRLRAPGGGWRWTNVRAAPLLDADGSIEKWLGLNIDIDDRKQAEAALRESEERYRALFESMDEAYAVVEVLKDDHGRWEDFRFLEVNRAFVEHTTMPWPVGKTATELLGSPNPRWTELYGQALDSGEPLRVEEPEATLGLIFDLNIFPLDREQNRVAVLFTNITSRKKVEAALRESEEQFRTLADTAPALIWRNDAKGENLFINRQFLELTGRSAEDIRSAGWHTLIHPDDAPAYIADYLAGVGAERAWQNSSRLQRHDGAWRSFENHAQPVLDAEGAYAGHVGVSVDVTDRVEAERALRALQERQAFLLELSDALRLTRDAGDVQATTTRLVVEHLVADRAMYAEVEGEHGAEAGTIRAQCIRQSAAGQPLIGRFPDHFTFSGFGAHTMAARYRGEPLVVTDVTSDPAFGAAERAAWCEAGVRAAIIAPLSKRGRLVAEFGVHCVHARNWTDEEVTLIQEIAERTWAAAERARAEAALAASEQFLRALLEGVSQLVWRAVDGGNWTWASPQWTNYTGQAAPESHGRGWLHAVHPDDRDAAMAVWAGALERGEFHANYRIRHAREGRYRWFQTRATPVRNSAGAIVEWLGTSTDVDDLRRLQERQQVLLAELQHRVRNILAVTHAMINRSNDGERPTEEYVQHLQGRISALARTQVLLTRSAGTAVDLEMLIRDELLAQAVDEDQISLQGVEIAISPKSAEVLTLAIHELATNATKYGAFSRRTGRLEVRWRSETRGAQDWLVIDWRERGVPIIDAVPRRQGFGSELISRRIPYELKGHGSFSLKPGGLESRIEFPLVAGESILQTDAGGR